MIKAILCHRKLVQPEVRTRTGRYALCLAQKQWFPAVWKQDGESLRWAVLCALAGGQRKFERQMERVWGEDGRGGANMDREHSRNGPGGVPPPHGGNQMHPMAASAGLQMPAGSGHMGGPVGVPMGGPPGQWAVPPQFVPGQPFMPMVPGARSSHSLKLLPLQFQQNLQANVSLVPQTFWTLTKQADWCASKSLKMSGAKGLLEEGTLGVRLSKSTSSANQMSELFPLLTLLVCLIEPCISSA